MPDYVITIKTEGGSAPKTKKVASNSSGEPVDNNESTGGFSDFLKSSETKVAGAYAIKYADLAITTGINRVELRTGNSTLQEKISYEYGITKRAIASAAAIGIGIATLNPVAIVAGVASIADIGIQVAIAQKNLDISREVEGIGLGMAQIRAGANGGRNGHS